MCLMERNKPPATVKAKALYMKKDLERMAAHHGVPLLGLKESTDMYDTLGAQRCATFSVGAFA